MKKQSYKLKIDLFRNPNFAHVCHAFPLTAIVFQIKSSSHSTQPLLLPTYQRYNTIIAPVELLYRQERITQLVHYSLKRKIK